MAKVIIKITGHPEGVAFAQIDDNQALRGVIDGMSEANPCKVIKINRPGEADLYGLLVAMQEHEEIEITLQDSFSIEPIEVELIAGQVDVVAMAELGGEAHVLNLFF